MAPSTETGVVRNILKAIYEHYPKTWHLTVHGSAMQKTGVPDLLLCIEGQFYGFEVKHQKAHESEDTARRRASTAQRIRIHQINQAGGVAAVILGPEEALEIIQQTLHL